MDPWTDAVRKALLQRGVGLADDGHYYLLPMHSEKDHPSQTVLDVLNARREWSRIHPRQMRGWVQDLEHTITRLVASDSNDSSALNAVFWLRLHGIFVDLRQQPTFQIIKSTSCVPPPGSDLEIFMHWGEMLEKVRSSLSENELLWAEYRRHVEAHVYQGAYEPQLDKRKMAAREMFTSKYTDRSYDVYDLDKRLGLVLAAYASEHDIVKSFAERLRRPVADLCGATARMFCS